MYTYIHNIVIDTYKISHRCRRRPLLLPSAGGVPDPLIECEGYLLLATRYLLSVCFYLQHHAPPYHALHPVI